MPRDYKKEYREFHALPEQKKHRAMRNTAHRQEEKKHGKSAMRGKEVDHIRPLSSGGSNAPSNRRLLSIKKNRGRNN
jgi:hypothetical protein